MSLLSLILLHLIAFFANAAVSYINQPGVDAPAIPIDQALYGHNVTLNAGVRLKSILNFADGEEHMTTLTMKIKQRKCLNIVVLGGSVSCYHLAPKDRTREYNEKEHTWPKLVEQYFNQEFPCLVESESQSQRDGGHVRGHVIENLSRNAKGSNYWIKVIIERNSDVMQSLERADVIFLDTDINDIFDNPQIQEHTSKEAEILYFLLRALSNNPVIMYIGTSSRVKCDSTGKKCFEWGEVSDNVNEGNTVIMHDDIVTSHLEIAKHYELPYVSLVDALGPFMTPTLAAFWRACKFDHVHLNMLGHQILTALVMNYFRTIMSSSHSPLIEKEVRHYAYNTVPLLYLTKKELDMYIHHRITPFYVDALDSWQRQWAGLPMHTNGFEITEDTSNKRGLIGHKIGSSVHFGVPPRHVPTNPYGMLWIPIFHSYNNVGSVNITVKTSETISNGKDKGTEQNCELFAPVHAKTIASVVVDCLWHTHASVSQRIEIAFNTSELFIHGNENENENGKGNAHSKCLHVCFDIVESAPKRENNKIKLYG